MSPLSPYGKGRGPPFKQAWILYIQGCFVPILIDMCPVVLGNEFVLDKLEFPISNNVLHKVWLILGKKIEIWKIYRWTDNRSDHTESLKKKTDDNTMCLHDMTNIDKLGQKLLLSGFIYYPVK